MYEYIFLQVKPLKGLSWGVGAVGNATWSGARLCDILKDLGINEEDYDHVQVLIYFLEVSIFFFIPFHLYLFQRVSLKLVM